MGANPLRQSLITRWQVIVFDLDNTLYPEWSYLDAAYVEISRVVAERWGIPATEVREQLDDEFRRGGRHLLFDRVLRNLDLGPEVLPVMLETLRTATPPEGLEVYPWAQSCLEYVRAHDRDLYILTNGNPRQQANKIRLLNHAGALDGVTPVFAQELGSKPDPAGLLEVSRTALCDPARMLFVGDSVIDAQTAENAGIMFVPVEEMRRIFDQP